MPRRQVMHMLGNMVKRTGLIASAILTNMIAFSQQKEFKAYTTKIPGTSVSFTMTPIPAGSFTMGSPGSEKGRGKDEGTTEKTEYRRILDGN